MYKILIVEDNNEINNLLKQILERNGYAAESAFNGLEAKNKLSSIKFDLVLLDLMLPFVSGDKILADIRETSQIPVIIISAKETTQMKVDLLRSGADDYITKPFDNDEILARIEAVFRRYEPFHFKSKKKIYKDMEIDFNEKSLKVNGQYVDLTATEYRLLETMLHYPTKVFSKENLFESVWGEEMPADNNALNVHMSRLRQKLKTANPEEEYIQTLWGLGYRLSK